MEVDRVYGVNIRHNEENNCQRFRKYHVKKFVSGYGGKKPRPRPSVQELF